MKNVFFVLLAICFCFGAQAQECLQGTVGITTQAQLDALDAEPWCVEGHLSLAGNSNIPSFTFNNLQYVTGCIYVIYRRPPANWVLEFNALESAGCVSISTNKRLTRVSFGDFIEASASVTIRGNGNIASIRLGSLPSTQNLRIYSNNSLSSLSARDLTEVEGDLEIYSNPLLPTCAIDDLVDYIDYGEANIRDNGIDSCYPWEP